CKAYIDKTDEETKSLARKWFVTTQKRYSKVVYKNPKDVKPDELNMYHGFSVDPKEGDVTLFKDLVGDIACNGDTELAEYAYNLFAYAVQNPFHRWDVALIAYSPEEGTGKDTLLTAIGDLLVDCFVTSNADRIIGRFNEQIAHKPVVI